MGSTYVDGLRDAASMIASMPTVAPDDRELIAEFIRGVMLTRETIENVRDEFNRPEPQGDDDIVALCDLALRILDAPVRELSADERSVWGVCPKCKAADGTFCKVRGDDECAHGDTLHRCVHPARVAAAPRAVRLVPCDGDGLTEAVGLSAKESDIVKQLAAAAERERIERKIKEMYTDRLGLAMPSTVSLSTAELLSIVRGDEGGEA